MKIGDIEILRKAGKKGELRPFSRRHDAVSSMSELVIVLHDVEDEIGHTDEELADGIRMTLSDL